MTAEEFPSPVVDRQEFASGFALARVAWVIPIPFLIVDLILKSASWFAPSGELVLFLIAIVQLRQLSRLQVKHFRNAEAAAKHQTIQGLSGLYKALDKRVFWVGLYGTLVWAYGDKFVKLLLSWIAA